ncbi:MAG: hypothetical protein Q9200_004888 [Gallowayella weberi]
MCMPYLIEIRPSHRKDRGRRFKTQGQTSTAGSSPPPCIITIEPRSPRLSQGNYSRPGSGIHIHGEASLRRKQEPSSSRQPTPKQPASPQSPPHKPSTCASQKQSRNSSSSSTSSSSSSSSTPTSKRSFQTLQRKFSHLLNRLTTLETSLSAHQTRTTQSLAAAAENNTKMEKDVAGLKDAVMGLGKELQSLRNVVEDISKRAALEGDRREDGNAQCDNGRDGDRRTRVEWERVRRLSRDGGERARY